MPDDLSDHDPALDPTPAQIREEVEREVDEVRREAHDEEAELKEHAARRAEQADDEEEEED
jgi:hypothetical protein